MKDASDLLFSYLYDNQPLFKSQLDLVLQLLADKNGPYYIEKSNNDEYNKAQSRLKTYISQLLSDTTIRNISEDFKKGLINLLKQRFNSDTEKIVNEILSSLKIKNSKIPKAELKASVIEQLSFDLNEASYIAIITSKPLEIDLQNDRGAYYIRNLLFKDLIDRLCDKNRDLKFYRFNFPLDSYGDLFWRGLRRILLNVFKNSISSTLIESLYSKFTLKTATLSKLENKSIFSDEDIVDLVDETLIHLNRNRFIIVFTNSAPIYSIPLVILNPGEHKNIRIYSLMEEESGDIKAYKYQEQDSILWRVFVWDKLKSKNYEGHEVLFSV